MIFKSINVDINEDILVEYDFNYELAGARLLGRDVSKAVNQKTKAVLLEILNQETDNGGVKSFVE